MIFKKPKADGLAKARKSFNKIIKQQPSDKLVEIVEDILRENESQPKIQKIAAKGSEPEANA
ncbi:MAG: hypothetical protein AABZ31_08280 [Bdellovibrionota bacterium]